MLNQSLAGLEFSCMVAINTVVMKGKIPNVRLMILYPPVLCMYHLRVRSKQEAERWRKEFLYPANMDPVVIAILLGKRCKPKHSVQD